MHTMVDRIREHDLLVPSGVLQVTSKPHLQPPARHPGQATLQPLGGVK